MRLDCDEFSSARSTANRGVHAGCSVAPIAVVRANAFANGESAWKTKAQTARDVVAGSTYRLHVPPDAPVTLNVSLERPTRFFVNGRRKANHLPLFCRSSRSAFTCRTIASRMGP